MAAVTTELKVLVKVAGDKGLDKLSRSLQNIGKQSQASSVKFDQVAKRLQQVQRNSNNSIASLRNYRNAWRDIAEQVDISSKEFKQATEEAKKLDAQLQKAQGRRKGVGGGRLRGAAQVAGTVAGAGVFGGPEGALGALGGGIIGGASGAIVGGTFGAQLGQLRKAAGGTAAYAANLEKLRTALFGVTTSQEEYLQALSLINKSTTDFAIPQEIVTRQFTRLQASVQGAGGNIEDTKVAFNGIVAAVRATGGSLTDVDAALTATAQVFSKGKVSAEELRQQIGERLPGAFTLFAESMNKTPQELDKALERGEVSLQDFQKFAEELFNRYGQTAQIIADGPASAGDRLNVALSNMNESVGRLLAPIGASFQDTFTEIIKLIDEAARRLNNFFGIGVEGLDKKVKDLAVQLSKVSKELSETPAPQGVFAERDEQGNLKILTRFAALENKQKQLRRELLSAQDQLNIAIEESERSSISQQASGTGLPGITPTLPKAKSGKTEAERAEERRLRNLARMEKRVTDIAIKEGNQAANSLKAYQDETAFLDARLRKGEDFESQTRDIFKLLDGTGTSFSEAFAIVEAGENTRNLIKQQEELKAKQKESAKELESLYKSVGATISSSIAGAIEGLIDNTKSLGESLADLAKSLSSMFIQFGVKSLLSSVFADGGVLYQNKIVPFARGGLVDKPTLFPMANGMGLMGEAGPEAIMPLRRGANGRLGVESSGGMGNVVVNVDATGTSVQGDDQQAGQLGRVIGAAVQAELVKQKRPGGLLAG
jgi:tape measure domain-containing protein